MTNEKITEVAFRIGMGRDSWEIHSVERRTPSGRIVCGPYSLNPDLSIRGRSNGYGPYRGELVTDEIREKVKRQNFLTKIKRCEFMVLTTPALDSISKIIQEDLLGEYSIPTPKDLAYELIQTICAKDQTEEEGLLEQALEQWLYDDNEE